MTWYASGGALSTASRTMQVARLALALAAAAPAAAQGPACPVTLAGANVWDGAKFAKRDLHVGADGRFGPAPASKTWGVSDVGAR